MSDVGKVEAKASTAEVVADTSATTAKDEIVQATEETETLAETEAEEVEQPEEASETEEAEGETTEDQPTKARRKREAKKRRLDALVSENQRLSEKLAAIERNKPAEGTLGPKPDRAKYEDEAEYVADLAVYRAEERAQARQAETYKTESSTARASMAEANVTLFFERAKALTDQYPDIEAKIKDPSLPMSAVMAETLMANEKGPQVAYYLSSNREEAQRIKEMSPLAAAAALGRLEAKLSLPKTRTETKAPPPPATVSGSVRGPARKLEDMDMAEYRKARGYD